MRRWPSVQQRFLSKIRPKESCIEWGGVLNKGYGMMKIGGNLRGAHRVSYEIFVGEIPTGLHLDHLCRNPKCVNPLHLEAVTIAENFRRGINHESTVTQCPQGHPYNRENTRHYVTREGRSERKCRACHRIWESNRYKRRIANA